MSLALVTGGCRRIGAAIAARLAQDGHALALHSAGDSAPDPGLARALDEADVDWAVFSADFEDADAVEGLVAEVAARFGRAPELLVNNAARFAFDTPDTVTMPAMLAHHAVNVAAPAILARTLAAALGPEGRGVIVNILDQRIAEPNGDQLSYTLSKLALAELTHILARHHAPRLRVVGVAPGLTLPTGDYAPGQMQRLAAAMPLRRLSRPEDIADAVAWLAGASAVTGQVLFVDGGAHLNRYERDFLFLGREEEA